MKVFFEHRLHGNMYWPCSLLVRAIGTRAKGVGQIPTQGQILRTTYNFAK